MAGWLVGWLARPDRARALRCVALGLFSKNCAASGRAGSSLPPAPSPFRPSVRASHSRISRSCSEGYAACVLCATGAARVPSLLADEPTG